MKHSYTSIKQSFHNQEPWLNVLVLKYITMPMVYFVVNYTKITPNIISIISLLFGLGCAYEKQGNFLNAKLWKFFSSFLTILKTFED